MTKKGARGSTPSVKCFRDVEGINKIYSTTCDWCGGLGMQHKARNKNTYVLYIYTLKRYIYTWAKKYNMQTSCLDSGGFLLALSIYIYILCSHAKPESVWYWLATGDSGMNLLGWQFTTFFFLNSNLANTYNTLIPCYRCWTLITVSQWQYKT